MRFLAGIALSGGQWLWPALLLALCGLGALVWSYRTAAPLGAWRWPCLLLKTLGLAALAFCLLEPHWTDQRAKPGANTFLVLADNSQSLQLKDRNDPRTRGEALRDILDPQRQAWPALLEEHFDTRRYRFDTRLQAVPDFGELAFDGPGTALASALRVVAERWQNRPLAGLLVFTDGNATDLGGQPINPAGLPPVFPVVLGQPDPMPDIALEQVGVTQTAFEDAPVTIQAAVRVAGFRGEPVRARLLDATGKVEQEQTQSGPPDGDTLHFRFQYRPQERGVSFHRLEVGAGGDTPAGRAAATAREATPANNHRVVAVDRGRGPYRILYVAGRPNWEFRYLNRALAEDDEVQLVGLIRVAKREPKFEFRGRAGETSNPLFRGFGDQSREETERYDQPVLVRLNTRDELELRAGFPITPEDLYPYHAVILDDLEAEFFSADQALLLQKFVSERGGGFLMLGGTETFQQGQYTRTPIGDMLPVYLGSGVELKTAGRWRLSLTREGWLQPWVRLRDQETEENIRLESMAPFQVLNALRDVKPGASVLATVANDAGQSHPALAVQSFGRGRTAALAVGDLWRWGLRDAEARRDLDKAWRQIARWLVADVPARVELAAVAPPDDPHGAVRLQVRARDTKFQPVDDATVTIDVLPILPGDTASPATNLVRLPTEASPTEPGLYEATFVPRLAAGFHARAFVTNHVGAELGRAEAGWASDPAADEFRALRPNVPLLEDLARQTGGRLVPAARLDEFVRELPRRQAPVMEAWSHPFWHTPAWFAFALACLLIEWGIRRRRGLP